MDDRAGEFTPEELRLAQRLFDERLRGASREHYRRLVGANDPALYRGPVRVPAEVIARLREEVAGEVRARRAGPAAPAKPRRADPGGAGRRRLPSRSGPRPAVLAWVPSRSGPSATMSRWVPSRWPWQRR